LYFIFHFVAGNSKNSTGGSSGGKNKSGKEWWQEEENKRLLLMTGSGLLVMYLLSGPSNSMREINWQDFRINYLERGEVDHVVISNKSLAKIYLKSDPANVSLLTNLLIYPNFSKKLECMFSVIIKRNSIFVDFRVTYFSILVVLIVSKGICNRPKEI
jgi:FtsH Extracellular.